MPEVIAAHKLAIETSPVLENLGLKKDSYFLVSAHREENIDNSQNFLSLMEAINHTAETYQLPVIYSTHPRAKKFIEERGFIFNPLVRNLPPFGFIDYNHLQMNAFCVLSDSGTLSEESAILGFPAILIRTSTERPEVVDKGSIVIGGINAGDIIQSIELTRNMMETNEKFCKPQDYLDLNVSSKVVKIIQSYTKIINEVVWRK
jgi:UDP-N-acetylglucosamine 2-epimerase